MDNGSIIHIDTVETVREPDINSLKDYFHLGIQLSYLVENVASEIRDMMPLADTIQLQNDFIRPKTRDRCSYCQWLCDTGNRAVVGRPDVFISHTWIHRFLDVIEALRQHFADNTNIFTWIGVFCGVFTNYPPNWIEIVLPAGIESFANTVLVVPLLHEHEKCLTRTSCLLEGFYFSRTAIVQIGAGLILEFLEDYFEGIHRSLFFIDFKQSVSNNYSSLKDDHLQIIHFPGGIKACNPQIIQILSRWVQKRYENEKREKLNVLLEENKDTEWNRGKLMIVGAGFAGKSALVRSLLGWSFKPELPSTIGLDRLSIDMQEASIAEFNDEKSNWIPYEGERNICESVVANLQLNYNKSKASIPCERSNSELAAGHQGNSDREDFVLVESTVSRSTISANRPSKDVELVEPALSMKLPAADIDPFKLRNEILHRVKIGQTKYDLTIYDFGGQTVFDVIHPFFLTEDGFYLVVFNMIEMADSHRRDNCFDRVRFWLNSITIHSMHALYSSTVMSPIFLVGTRKDQKIVSSVSAHKEISQFLSSRLQNHPCIGYVIENQDLLFYPVDNTQGWTDSTIRKLAKDIEKSISQSSIVSQRLPLSWTKIPDKMKEYCKTTSSLSFSEVLQISKQYNMLEDQLPEFLTFLHKMGIAMWHNEPSLADTVIWNPTEFFVKPATRIICKHKRDEGEHAIHELEIHKLCQRTDLSAWLRMLDEGIVTERLLHTLLSDFTDRKGKIIYLMKKYALILELAPEMQWNSHHKGDPTSEEGPQIKYLVPALLPLDSPKSSIFCDLVPLSMYFAFDTALLLKTRADLRRSDLHESSFLPTGLFERFLCRIASYCSIPFESSRYWSRTEVIMVYHGQQFRMINISKDNMITVEIYSPNPIPVYLLLITVLRKVLLEAYPRLIAVPLLPYQMRVGEERMIRFDYVKNEVEKNPHSSLAREFHWIFNQWLYNKKQRIGLSDYDIFLEFRPMKKALGSFAFGDLLYQCFCHFNLLAEIYSPISCYRSYHSGKSPTYFPDDYISALIRSKIYVLVITKETVRNLLDWDYDTSVNDLLAQWLVFFQIRESTQCIPAAARLQIVPILLPAVIQERNRNEFAICDFESNYTLEHVKNLKTIPTTTILELERTLLKYNMRLEEKFKTMSVGKLFEKLLDFADDQQTQQEPAVRVLAREDMDHLAMSYCEDAARKLASMYQSYPSFGKRGASEDDLFYYNLPTATQSMIPSTITASSLANITHFEVFLSHTWGPKPDQKEHQFVRSVANKLYVKYKIPCFIDEYHARGDLKSVIGKAIESCKVFIAFLSTSYNNKLKTEDTNDYCYWEFRFAARILKEKRFILATLEDPVEKFDNWADIIQQECTNRLYFPMCDWENPSRLDEYTETLRAEIVRIIHLPEP